MLGGQRECVPPSPNSGQAVEVTGKAFPYGMRVATGSTGTISEPLALPARPLAVPSAGRGRGDSSVRACAWPYPRLLP